MRAPQQSLDQRLARFVRDRVEPALVADRAGVRVTAWPAPFEPVPFDRAVERTFGPMPEGTAWGSAWSTLWMRVDGRVPDAWAGAGGRVELRVDPGFAGDGVGFQVEALVYDDSGRVLKGIEPRNDRVRVPAAPGESFTVFVEAAANPDVLDGESFTPTELGRRQHAGDPLYRRGRIELVRTDEDAWELARDIETLWGLTRVLPEASSRRARVVAALHAAMDAVDPGDVRAGVAEARRILAPVLAVPAEGSAHRVYAVGHAHIDSAWLWPTRETVRKCARTFSNVLALMDEDPDLVFACSSAQQYLWVKEHYPDLYQRIRERVAEGRFLPVGGMWVESDTNLPGGEALARQFIEGTRFFLEEFGVESSVVWLPDSFGFTAALPQIALAAGAESFLTQKLSWNETNAFPHHSFLWEGIDGSRIFAHLPPVDTYNSQLSQDELAYLVGNFSQKGEATASLVPFGFGDGGGGPTREMMAAARRAASLEGSPTVRHANPAVFFANAQAELVSPPVWAGELYLESHRGVYASQARTKRANRRSEHLLHEAELWAATATVRTGAPYPAERLREAWHLVLLNQFHDILPGSSIGWVYDQAEEEYRQVAAWTQEIISSSLDALAAAGTGPAVPAMANAGPFPIAGVAPFSVGEAHAEADDVTCERADDGWVLQNGSLRACFDGQGLITSLVDRRGGEEYVPPGQRGNLPQLFVDAPRRFDAWDLDAEYRHTARDLAEATSVAPLPAAPGEVGLEIERVFGDSRLRQVVRLHAGRSALQIDTEVDWHERQRMLKLAFPVDVHTASARSEIQFGHIDRPTHENTSWDQARFETVAHRWVHVADAAVGLGVVNDAVYGHDVTRHARPGGGTYSRVRQTLLKAPLFPDPEADQGVHRFTTVLVPGDLAETIREGYRTNLPLRPVTSAPVAPLIRASEGSAVVETVKLADDGSGDVVVRLYESHGARATVRVAADFPCAGAVATDLLERPLGDADPTRPRAWDAGDVRLSLRPFELVTLRFRRADVARG
ncbi:alpha-mannosidase [Georgenia faecalis]|uniref:Alpha-mannosidase n=1 Tax=Georgenia faecalis TaxID=2483799 RepID=A0ABV9DAU0_9MICO|nr:glycoside hydrolase family 38 C-terminal domain-containing protein [Georgenia faecalis]